MFRSKMPTLEELASLVLTRYLLGLSSFEQFEDRVGEVMIYVLAKFARLALANNPNMLDILWADEEDVLYVDVYGLALRDARGHQTIRPR